MTKKIHILDNGHGESKQLIIATDTEKALKLIKLNECWECGRYSDEDLHVCWCCGKTVSLLRCDAEKFPEVEACYGEKVRPPCEHHPGCLPNGISDVGCPHFEVGEVE